MRQKAMWMHYLRLGSLMAITLISICSCKAKEDDIVRAEWIYVNETTSSIEIISDSWNSFILEPEQSHTIQTSGLGRPDIKPENYAAPYVAGDKIKVNNNEHTFVKSESITNVNNYSSSKLDYNYYRFTYVFTDELIDSW